MTILMNAVQQRNDRYRDIVPADKLQRSHAIVVGVGAVGRQVALQLAAMGCPKLTLIDFDTVEPANLGPQGWEEQDLGSPKVISAAESCWGLNSKAVIDPRNERFRALEVEGYLGDMDETDPHVFCCVDDMDVRRAIWEALRGAAVGFYDGRMAAETLQVFAVEKPDEDAYYETQLFPQAEAYQGSCTAKSTIYCANVVAGFLVGQFTKHLRGGPCERKVVLNLLSMEMEVQE